MNGVHVPLETLKAIAESLDSAVDQGGGATDLAGEMITLARALIAGCIEAAETGKPFSEMTLKTARDALFKQLDRRAKR